MKPVNGKHPLAFLPVSIGLLILLLSLALVVLKWSGQPSEQMQIVNSQAGEK